MIGALFWLLVIGSTLVAMTDLWTGRDLGLLCIGLWVGAVVVALVVAS